MVEFNKTRYKIFIIWTAIGRPKEDYFAIQAGRQKGFLQTLLNHRDTDEEINNMIFFLSAALNRIPSIANLQWLTDDEFKSFYCGGQPLPELGME